MSHKRTFSAPPSVHETLPCVDSIILNTVHTKTCSFGKPALCHAGPANNGGFYERNSIAKAIAGNLVIHSSVCARSGWGSLEVFSWQV